MTSIALRLKEKAKIRKKGENAFVRRKKTNVEGKEVKQEKMEKRGGKKKKGSGTYDVLFIEG